MYERVSNSTSSVAQGELLKSFTNELMETAHARVSHQESDRLLSQVQDHHSQDVHDARRELQTDPSSGIHQERLASKLEGQDIKKEPEAIEKLPVETPIQESEPIAEAGTVVRRGGLAYTVKKAR